MRFWDEISTRLAGLSSATPEEARQALNEFDTRDIQAVRVSEGGGGGGSGPLTVSDPFPITKDTAGLVNPGGNGLLVDPVLTAPVLVLAAWIETTTPWEAETSVDEVDIVLNTSGLPLYQAPSNPASLLNADVYQLAVVQSGSDLVAPFPAFIQNGTDQVAVAMYTTGAMTAGAGNVRVLYVTLT